MKNLLLAAAGFALLATPAFAKKHCVKADGSEVADAANRKACKAAGGKWKSMKKAKADKAAPPADAAAPAGDAAAPKAQ